MTETKELVQRGNRKSLRTIRPLDLHPSTFLLLTDCPTCVRAECV